MGKAKKKDKKSKKKKKKKKKKKQEVLPVEPDRGFLLDIIILKIISDQINPEDTDSLGIDVAFHKSFIKITSSRLNVIDFIPDRSYVFQANSQTIGGILSQYPLVFTVNYNNKPIGTVIMKWPEAAKEALQKLKDITFEFKEHLTTDGTEDSTSKLEALIRLQPKCLEMPDDMPTCLPDKCEAAQKTISPNDVIFLVGDEYNVEACHDIPFYQTRKNETLDFAAYQIYHGGTLAKLPELPNTFCSLKCCRIKEVAREFGPGVFDYLHCDKELQKKNGSKFKAKFVQCEITSDVTSSTSLTSCSNYGASDEEAEGCKQCDVDRYVCESPQYNVWNTPVECFKARCCKKCKVKLKYADPKAPCAICGMKPSINIPEQKPQCFTADEILQEYINKNPSKNITCLDCPMEINEKDSTCSDSFAELSELCPCFDKICECRCHDGKVCAYCRVRNTCEVVDLRTLDPDENIKSIERTDMETTCEPPEVEPEYIPPFLATLLNELKSIYQIDDQDVKLCKERLQKYKRVQRLKKLFRPEPGEYQSYNMTPTDCKEIKQLCRDMQAKLERPKGRIKKPKPILGPDNKISIS